MRRISLPVTSFLSLVLAVPSFSQPSTVSPDAAPETVTPEYLLQRAHDMLPALSTTDRVFVLAELANASVRTHSKNATVWMDEAWATASRIPDRRTRTGNQSLLLQYLPELDSRAALDRLAIMEPPLHPGDDDPRELPARFTFYQFYRDHPSEADKIIAVARHIGDTGSYPLNGVFSVVGEMLVRNAGPPTISPENQGAANVLIRDAIRYFREGIPSGQANEEFAILLRTDSQLIPPELLKPALQELVGRLLLTPRPPVDRMITMIPDKSGAPPVFYGNRNHIVLAGLMPLVRSIDPAWERTLRQTPEFNQVLEKVEDGSGVAILGAYSEGASNQTVVQRLQADSVRQLGYQHPDEAATLLEGISDPVAQAGGAAGLAGMVKDSRPQESFQLLARAEQALEKIKSPRDRMFVLFRLSYSLVSLKQAGLMAAALDQGLAAGDEARAAYAASRPNSSATAAFVAAPYLAAIVQNSARIIPEYTLMRISDVRVPAWQAYLLAGMARTVDPGNAQTQVPIKVAAPKK
jgi:hypothetical protein